MNKKSINKYLLLFFLVEIIELTSRLDDYKFGNTRKKKNIY